jgi:putative flippase GtrA
VLSAVANYFLNYYLTFRSAQSHSVAASRYVVVCAGDLAVNAGVMYGLVNVLRLHYLISQLLATGAVMIRNLIAHQFWTYQGKQQ